MSMKTTLIYTRHLLAREDKEARVTREVREDREDRVDRVDSKIRCSNR